MADFEEYKGFVRRLRVDRFVPAERTIFDASQLVEKLGADPTLTEAVNLLHKARDIVADFIEKDPRCKACGEKLEICRHCSGSDESDDAGTGQRGYYICDRESCEAYEGCCGC